MSTVEQERREVLESVAREMAGVPLDDDRADACSYLLRHLARTSTPRPWFGYPIPQESYELRQHL
jgi:hypothetical protein